MPPLERGKGKMPWTSYFHAQNKLEKLIETYRFLALKTHTQQQKDRVSYEKAFKDKKPWPDPEDVQAYKVERRLAEAPKEWNPEDRIKKKPLAPSAEEPKE